MVLNIDYQNFIFDDTKSNLSNLKRVKAKVLNVEEDNTSALVEIIGEGIRIVLYNKTNELISIGDIVTVEYSKFLSSKTGYIILRNGKPENPTTTKLNEVFTSVSNGKNLIASAITDKGVATASDASFSTMADNIRSISGGGSEGNINLSDIFECVTISNSVTSIADSTFENCTNLTSVTIPNSVTLIGGFAFHNCYNLTNITIPDSVTSIGVGAFYYCTSLMDIIIPNSVLSINMGSFSDCYGLTSITIPNSVTELGVAVFCNCYYLENIYYTGTEEQWNAIAKYNGWDYYMGVGVSGGTQIHYNYNG